MHHREETAVVFVAVVEDAVAHPSSLLIAVLQTDVALLKLPNPNNRAFLLHAIMHRESAA